MIRDVADCNAFRRERGEPIAAHFDPDDFTDSELLDLFTHAECPLHVTKAHPDVPEGMWKLQVHQASVAIAHLVPSLPKTPSVRSRGLVAVWRKLPDARWWFERHDISIPPNGAVACRSDGCTDPLLPEN